MRRKENCQTIPILLTLLLIINISFADVVDWYKVYNNSHSIEVGSTVSKNNDDIIGNVHLIGWSESGLFAYLFDPLEVLVCEVEPTFYIIDAKKNINIFEKHLCDYNLSNFEDFKRSGIEDKLIENKIIPIDSIDIIRHDSRVLNKNGEWLLYVGSGLDEKLIWTLRDSGQGIDNVYKADGYLTSPFNPKLKVYFFGIELAAGNVAVIGNTMSKSKFQNNLYKTGVGVVNNDSVSRSFYRSYPMISSKICLIKEPTDKIKNGIAPFNIHQRKLPLGITVTNDKEGALVTIAPGSEICCLSARGTTILTKDYGEISVKSGERLIFVDGTIVVEQVDGSFKNVNLKK